MRIHVSNPWGKHPLVVKPLNISNAATVFQRANWVKMDYVKLNTDKDKLKSSGLTSYLAPEQEVKHSYGLFPSWRSRWNHWLWHWCAHPLPVRRRVTLCTAHVLLVSEISQNATLSLFTSCCEEDWKTTTRWNVTSANDVAVWSQRCKATTSCNAKEFLISFEA